MKKFIAILLVLVLCAGVLSGCASAKIDEALVGTWNLQLDIAQPMIDLLKQQKLDAVLDEMDLSGTKIDINLTFGKDASFCADVDVAALEKLSAAATKAAAAAPELERQLKESGVDISGVTGLVKTLFPEKDGQKKATLEGKFKVENGKLFLGWGKTITIYADGCAYKVENNTLTITDMDGNMGESVKNILPLEFKKV